MKVYADDRLVKNQNISHKVVFVGKNVKREIVYTLAVAAFFVMFCNEFRATFLPFDVFSVEFLPEIIFACVESGMIHKSKYLK